MGHKDKKKHKHRSKSRERSESKKEKKKYTERSYSSEDSDHHSRSRSRDYKHKKKQRHRSRSEDDRNRRKRKHDSSDSSSSEDSDDRRGDSKFRSRRPEDIQRLKEERRQQKEILKATETPEEKRARRLAKKEAKERKRKEKMGWDQDYLGYTNQDNPFGDEHLLDTFVWGKKMEKEGKKHLEREEIQKLHKNKMEENRRELEKVKKRRLEREREREEREREREALQREKEVDYFSKWEKQEDSFHLNQAKLRSEIRIQDGRAKPIDLLAKYISAEDDELAIEMHEPYTYLYGLTIADLEDLLVDIRVYLEMEQGKNADYWRDIITVTEDELNKLKKLDASQREFHDRREGINESVHEEVSSIFKGKSTNQLALLEEQIKKKLKGGEGVDVGYWESLLQQLKAHMARTRLRERHQDVLRQKLFKLKQEQGIESDPLFPAGILRSKGSPRSTGSPASVRSRSPAPARTTDSPAQEKSTESPLVRKAESPLVARSTDSPLTVKIEPQPCTSSDTAEPQPGTSSLRDEAKDSEDEGDVILTEQDLEEEEEEIEQEALDYTQGCYSPKLMEQSDLPFDTVVYDPEDDMKKLELARTQVLTGGKVQLDTEKEFFEKKAREGMDDDEAQFSVEFPLEQQAFMWSDKYRPRKPRFFNRVHTGFEWNKYNQTHYDIDNPPPKIVQGYKFNIFYPDLIDKTQTPEYTLTPLDDNKDFASLKFHAGPPYEDIAFKVVNREWEFSYKRGFRCQFSNNIFQLWFHFKRYRYRR